MKTFTSRPRGSALWSTAAGVTCLAIVAATSAGGAGRAGWQPGYALPGAEGDVFAFTTYGELLVAGGDFTRVSDAWATGVAAYDGSDWSPLGDGLAGDVLSLAVYGGDLVAGGGLKSAGGEWGARVFRWDGSRWVELGTGLGRGEVSSLAVFDGDLYAAGQFPFNVETPRTSIARWTGTEWAAVGNGVQRGVVQALQVYGDRLVIGGNFDEVSGVEVQSLAAWDGRTWSPVAPGLGSYSSVGALHVDGEGFLVAGGSFFVSGDWTRAARWDGEQWHPMGPRGDRKILDFQEYGGQLYAAGSRVNFYTQESSIRAWDGNTWIDLNPDLTVSVYALEVYEGRLFVGGDFRRVMGVPARGVMSFDGESWEGSPGLGVGPRINDLTSFDGHLVLTGTFRVPDSYDEGTMLLADGGWVPLKRGISVRSVEHLDRFRDALVLAGSFGSIDTVRTNSLIAWDGERFTGFGSGIALTAPYEWRRLEATAEYGGGLVIAGRFDHVDAVAANNVAFWNGSTWSPLGSGSDAVVNALAVFRGELIAAGDFEEIGGVPAVRVGRWDGRRWNAMASGVDGEVLSLAAYGDHLYAAGEFETAGGVEVNNIARWDGNSWSAVAGGVDLPVHDMVVYNNTLVVGGEFGAAGGVEATAIARWDGVSWGAMGTGLGGRWTSQTEPYVDCLCVHDGALFAAGIFNDAGGYPCADLARWEDYPPGSPHPPGPVIRVAGSPFQRSVKITFEIRRSAMIRATIHDILGRRVKVLSEGFHVEGRHVFWWNGYNDEDLRMASGVYFLRVSDGRSSSTRKLLLLRADR